MLTGADRDYVGRAKKEVSRFNVNSLPFGSANCGAVRAFALDIKVSCQGTAHLGFGRRTFCGEADTALHMSTKEEPGCGNVDLLE